MFPPGAGGNHYKNLLCLDPSFYNSKDFTDTAYNDSTSTVHALPGNNFNPSLLPIAEHEDKQVIMHGHFGELATHADEISNIKNKKIILIALNERDDFEMLHARNAKLPAPYNLSGYHQAEQFFLYQPKMCQVYFDLVLDDICCIKLSELWQPDLKSFDIVDRLNYFLDTHIDYNQAQTYHSVWYKNNFL